VKEEVTMDNPRPEKVAVVDEVRRRLDGSDAAILTEYRGLKVKDLESLRRSLRSNGGEYKIYKNTLVRKAALDSGLEGLDPLLRGPTGITFVSGDASAVAKVLRDFSRTNPLLVIKGGLLGEKVLGAAETAALADLPSREVLLAQLAGAMAAPLQQFASLLQALPRNLAYGLAALRDRLGEGAPESEPAAEAAAPVAEAAAPEAEPAAPEAEPAAPVAEAAAPESQPAAEGAVPESEPAAEAAVPVAEAAAPEAEPAAPVAEAAAPEAEPLAEAAVAETAVPESEPAQSTAPGTETEPDPSAEQP
jgi:large subunit ribosomal protein L10